MRRVRGRTWLTVAAALLLAGCSAGLLPAIHSEAERLAVARRMMAERHWPQAIELLKTYVANNAGSADVDEAIYLLGESYLRSKDWASAQIELERLLRDYPESDSSAAASFALGEAYFGQARGPDFDQEFTHKALDQWERYRREHPDHWQVPEAGRRIDQARQRLATKLVHTGQLYLKLDLPQPARMYFEQVIADYADLPQSGDALIGLALADLASDQRDKAIAELRRLEAEHGGTPLGDRARRERERLER